MVFTTDGNRYMERILRLLRRLVALSLLLAASLASVELNAAGAIAACPLAISTGQPACGSTNDVGSSSPSSVNTRHVGNPIDVVSGNKYQREVDVRLGGSQLSFVRHYNSANTGINVGIGRGWQHSYSVVLTASGDGTRQVLQSDGRLVVFQKQSDQQSGSESHRSNKNSTSHTEPAEYTGSRTNQADSTAIQRYVAQNERDGYLLADADNRHRWHLPDGRVLSFLGSFLTGIEHEDGGRLTLFYRKTRLHSVTDELGKSLVFHYAAGERGLPAYEPSIDQSSPGHLQAIELPDGSMVRYRYSQNQNLVAVEYPFGTRQNQGRRYGYQDQSNSALLTEVSEAVGKPKSRWTYDEHGRANSYRSSFYINPDGSNRGDADLILNYMAGQEANQGITSVSYKDGSRTEYHWRVDELHHVVELTEQTFEAPKIDIEPQRLSTGESEASTRTAYRPDSTLR